MPKEPERTEQIMSEIDALRRQVAELQGIEQRCRQAEATLNAFEQDNTDLKKAEEDLRESEKRYRQLFQSAPIALIEWDASHLKTYLEELRGSGISDFSAYLVRNPQQVHHCWSLIKAVDHNQAFLELMGVADRAELSGAFIPTDAKGFLKMAREVILVAAAAVAEEERELTLVTTTGELKTVLGKSLVVSGHEDTLARVAIALVVKTGQTIP